MQATFTKTEYDGKIPLNRKESHFRNQYTIVTTDFRTPVIARIYGTDRASYACLWVNHKDIHISGGGKAGGYGYHRSSAALGDAIADAGIKLSEDIGGRGDGAMREALEAVAKALGLVEFGLIEAHA